MRSWNLNLDNVQVICRDADVSLWFTSLMSEQQIFSVFMSMNSPTGADINQSSSMLYQRKRSNVV